VGDKLRYRAWWIVSYRSARLEEAYRHRYYYSTIRLSATNTAAGHAGARLSFVLAGALARVGGASEKQERGT
jgi:hypothetical protein